MRIISGVFKGRKLHTASGSGYRPATDRVRESLFSILESNGVQWCDLRVLDLFAGSGALALEALSRGAQSAVLVEKNPKAAKVLRNNLLELQLSQEKVLLLKKDAFLFLKGNPRNRFDMVFVDPPYGQGLVTPVLRALLQKEWLEEGAFVQTEIEGSLTLPCLDHLSLVKEKNYGQTKVCLWKKISI